MQVLFNNDGIVELYNNWFDDAYASELFMELKKNLDWQEEEITIFGKKVKCPRLTAFYGDPNVHYRYSGTNHSAKEWPSLLLTIKNNLLIKLGLNFNSVLCNFYKDGADYMGWHSDDESELGREPIIASLSLGETRTFQFKHKVSHELVSTNLVSGTLCIMRGKTQHCWKHRISPTRKHCDSRINLTFRNVRVK